jgi:tRNA A-37 threonylcarbamoyl transferase component Bud32/GAF domain-containing protein
LSDQIRRQPPFFWLALAVGTALFVLYPFAVSVLVRAGGVETDLGWVAGRDAQGRMSVTRVDAGGPADGRLAVGDVVLTVNGEPLVARGVGWVLFMDLRPGNRYRVGVQHDGTTVDHELTVAARSNLQKVWLIQVPLLAISFCFFVTGLGVALMSSRARVARLYAVAALVIAALLIPGGVFLGDVLHGRDRLILLAVASITPFVYPVIYQFFVEFPPGVSRHPFWHRLKFLLYAWAAAFFPVNALTNFAALQGSLVAGAFIRSHATLFAITDVAASLYLTTSIIAIVGVIVRNYVAVDDPAQRRRLRWVFLGSIAAATPFAVLFVADLIASLAGVQFEYFAWLRAQTIAQLFLVFLPVTFTYAVVAHRVVGVEVVVRRGLRYLLARNVLRAAAFLPLLLIAASVAINPDRTVPQILFQNPFVAGLAIAAAVGLSTRERLERWLDRRFFRDASQRDQLLIDLVHELARRDDVRGLDTLVVTQVERALHAQDVCLVEASSSESAGTRLAVPIRSGSEPVLGWLLLGDKKSEEPYTSEDRRLLEAVAAQIAVVRENAALRRTAAHDARVKQEVLARIDAAAFNLLKECPACGACYDHSDDTCAKDGRALSLSVPVDRTIEGKYRLEQLLGRGGMGTVYAATDIRLGRSVAVKLLRDAALASDESRRRFHREARTYARLRHDHIINVYDYGTTGHDVAYLVMEKLSGATLRTLLRRRGCFAPAIVAEWFAQMLDGVACAHAAGVIHRDLKPENVFVTRDHHTGASSITLLDFGLAKLNLASADESRSLTTPGSVMGTLGYMSPEQLLGTAVDERSDLYAIGVMVLESITGRNPFQRDDPQETVAAILHEPACLSSDEPAIKALDAVLQRSIAKNREHRFATAIAMQAALIPALRASPPLNRLAAAGDEAETTM